MFFIAWSIRFFKIQKEATKISIYESQIIRLIIKMCQWYANGVNGANGAMVSMAYNNMQISSANPSLMKSRQLSTIMLQWMTTSGTNTMLRISPNVEIFLFQIIVFHRLVTSSLNTALKRMCQCSEILFKPLATLGENQRLIKMRQLSIIMLQWLVTSGANSVSLL